VSAPPLRVVGRPVARIDAIEKVTGRARYVTDLALPGMAHARVLRSPYAHARLARVETGRARALPGVVAVLAGADLTWCDPYFGPAFRDRPILAIDVARHEGEPVAAVAAIDEPTAVAALELIDVDYEPLAAALTLEDALAPGAPLVHTREPLAGHFADLASLRPRPGTNVCHQFHFARGDAATALASADLVVEDTFRFPAVQHYALEPHAAVAAWDETGGLTVWASTQNPYSVRVELAKMFDVPLARIRIVVPHLGGGFGSKTYAKLEPLAAALAHAAGRPVRLAASAAEAFQIVRRCSARVTMRVGFGGDGTLAAVQCDAQYDVGAYADIGPRVVQKATYTATGPYRVPHVDLGAAAVYTRSSPSSTSPPTGSAAIPSTSGATTCSATARRSPPATRPSTASSRRAWAVRPRRSAGRSPAPPIAGAASPRCSRPRSPPASPRRSSACTPMAASPCWPAPSRWARAPGPCWPRSPPRSSRSRSRG